MMPSSGAILNSLKDAIPEVVTIFESAKREILFIVPPAVLSSPVPPLIPSRTPSVSNKTAG
jgi:hypothetical protein